MSVPSPGSIPWIAAVLACLVLVPQAEAQESEAPDRESVKEAMNQYKDGLVHRDADRIPLASDVTFVMPDGTTIEEASEVAPFLEHQGIDSIRVHRTLIEDGYGCELTTYYWTDGPTVPIALCIGVQDKTITEIRPYFDSSLLSN